jgi:hypothetical protein
MNEKPSISPTDFELYLSFVPRLTQMVDVAVPVYCKQNGMGHRPGKEKAINDAAKEVSKDPYQAYRAATSTRKFKRITLSKGIFSALRDNLLSKVYDDEELRLITLAYDVYYERTKSRSGHYQKFPSRHKKTHDAQGDFEYLLNTLKVEVQFVLSEEKNFQQFLVKAVDAPSSVNNHSAGIENSKLIHAFLLSGRNDNSYLRKLPEETYCTWVAKNARMGAWAAQSIGYDHIFEHFVSIHDRFFVASRTDLQISKGLLSGHSDRLLGVTGDKNYQSNGHLNAFLVLYENMRSGSNGDLSHYSVAASNSALELVRRGYGLNDKNNPTNHSIADLLKIAQEIGNDSSDYLPIQKAMMLACLAGAYMNENKIDLAERQLEKMAAALRAPRLHDTATAAFHDWYRGKLEYLRYPDDPEWEDYFQLAIDQYKGIGAFHFEHLVTVDYTEKMARRNGPSSAR